MISNKNANHRGKPTRLRREKDQARLQCAIMKRQISTLVEFLKEVSLQPYNDSDIGSLLQTLRARASHLLKEIGK